MNEGWILIGDCHSTPHETQEVEALLDYCAELAIKHETKGCVLLGDLFDTHQNIHLDVVYSYSKMFNKYSQLEWLLIPGNHDHSVHGNRLEHALLPFKTISNVKIFDAPNNKVQSYDGMDFAPFTRTEEEFLELCSGKQNDLLICHQEFKGAQYEGGFYAPNGTDLEKVPYKQIISGHIHKSAQLKACFYLGAPRWFTLADANEPKFVYLMKDRRVPKQFGTENVCKAIYKFEIDERSELPEITKNAKYILEVRGKAKFIEKINHLYAGKAEIRGIAENSKEVLVQESKGINQALETFILKDYQLKYVEDKQAFWKRLQEELNEIK